jgi:hypothetical protein
VAKLYFRYGTMDSAKSMNLHRKQGKRERSVGLRTWSRLYAARAPSPIS